MNKWICGLFTLAMINGACHPASVGLTAAEHKGIREVLNLYGGTCSYSIGVSLSTESGPQKIFELDISKSKTIEEMASFAELPASGAAYVFYKNIYKENHDYTLIKSKLVFSTGQSQTWEYSLEKLKTVKDNIGVADSVIQMIKAKKIDDLVPDLADTGKPNSASGGGISRQDFKKETRTIVDGLGNIKEVLFLGFRFSKMPDGTPVLHTSWQIIGEKDSAPFSMLIDPASKGNKMRSFAFRI